MGSYYESYYNSAYNTTYNSDGTTTYYNSAYNTSTNDTYGSTSYYNSAYSTNYNSDGSTSYYNSAYSTSYNDTYGSTSYYNSAYNTSSGYSPSSDYSTYYYSDYYSSTYSPSSSTYYSSYSPSYSSYSPSYSSYSGYSSTYTPYSSSGYSSYKGTSGTSSSSYKPTYSSAGSSSSSSYSSYSSSSGNIGKIIGIIFACLVALGMLSGLITSIISCVKDSAEKQATFTVEQVENGSMSISSQKLETKETMTLTAAPNDGYFLAYTIVYYKGREDSSNSRECVDGDILVVFGDSFTVPFGGEATIVPVFLPENDGSPVKIGREDIEYDAAYYFDGYYDSDTKNVYRNIYIYGLKSYLNKVAAGYSYVELVIEMDVAENGTVTWEDSRFFGHQQTNSKQIITAFNFVNNIFSMEKGFALTYGKMDHGGDAVSDIYSRESTTLKIATSKLTDQIFLGFAIDQPYNSQNDFDPTIAWKFKNFTLAINPTDE